MAEVAMYTAYVSVKDSANKLTSVECRVSDVDGKAYVAAADEAARALTKVGLLLIPIKALMLTGTANYYEVGVKTGFRNDGFVRPAADSEIFNSNKLNIAYQTSIGGLPTNRDFTIPQRNTANYAMESNGTNVVIGAGATATITDLITQVADTLLSIFGTACNIVEITVNDQ